jgi:hypothetical protein
MTMFRISVPCFLVHIGRHTLLFLIGGFFVVSPVAAETLTFAVKTPAYRLTTNAGRHEPSIDGFGALAYPGNPLLPQKTYLIALPPGAVVRSASVTGTGLTPVPGSFRIEPAPVLETLTAGDRFGELRERMQNELRRGLCI